MKPWWHFSAHVQTIKFFFFFFPQKKFNLSLVRCHCCCLSSPVSFFFFFFACLLALLKANCNKLLGYIKSPDSDSVDTEHCPCKMLRLENEWIRHESLTKVFLMLELKHCSSPEVMRDSDCVTPQYNLKKLGTACGCPQHAEKSRRVTRGWNLRQKPLTIMCTHCLLRLH